MKCINEVKCIQCVNDHSINEKMLCPIVCVFKTFPKDFKTVLVFKTVLIK